LPMIYSHHANCFITIFSVIASISVLQQTYLISL
jgi:hypothetical protein